MVSVQDFMQGVRERISDTYHLQAADAFELLLNWAAYSWTKLLWAYWKEKFQEFAAREDFSEECRSITSQAARKMGEIESCDQD